MGSISAKVLGPRTRTLFLLVIFALILIVIAVFGVVISAVFSLFPTAVAPVWLQIDEGKVKDVEEARKEP